MKGPSTGTLIGVAGIAVAIVTLAVQLPDKPSVVARGESTRLAYPSDVVAAPGGRPLPKGYFRITLENTGSNTATHLKLVRREKTPLYEVRVDDKPRDRDAPIDKLDIAPTEVSTVEVWTAEDPSKDQGFRYIHDLKAEHVEFGPDEPNLLTTLLLWLAIASPVLWMLWRRDKQRETARSEQSALLHEMMEALSLRLATTVDDVAEEIAKLGQPKGNVEIVVADVAKANDAPEYYVRNALDLLVEQGVIEDYSLRDGTAFFTKTGAAWKRQPAPDLKSEAQEEAKA